MPSPEHRIILIVPSAKVAAVVTWFGATIGAAALSAGLGPLLSATGAAPATHAWCCGSFDDAQAKAILLKMCSLAGVAQPTNAQWTGWTGDEKRTWLRSVQAALLAGYGAWVGLADNLGVWDSPAAALTAMGLKEIGGAA